MFYSNPKQSLCVACEDKLTLVIGDQRIVEDSADKHRRRANRVIGAKQESVGTESVNTLPQESISVQSCDHIDAQKLMNPTLLPNYISFRTAQEVH